MAQTGWVHHVSFDDLAPSIIDDEVEKARKNGYILGSDRYGDFIHVPPQFNTVCGSRHGSNASGEWSSPPSSFHGCGGSKHGLWARLPPPPEVSSLKQTKYSGQRDSTKDYDLERMDWQEERAMDKDTDINTERNSCSGCGSCSEAESSGCSNGAIVPTRKTFAGMSDEELAKLEDLYNSRSWSTQKSTMDKFDFHEQRSLMLDNHPGKHTSFQGAIVDPLIPVYPTRPVVTHKAISLTRQNVNFEESRRVVSCYISGRRHSWAAADWYVENASHDGDHFVIITTVSNFENYIAENNSSRPSLKLTRSLSASDSRSNTPFSSYYPSQSPLSLGIRLSEIHEKAKRTCKNILDYYAFRLDGKVVRITVEMVKENSSKNTVTNAVNLYKPDLQIISTVSTNIQIKFRNGKMKLANFIMRHYSMPTCIVPYEFIDPRLLREDAGIFPDEDGMSTPQQQRLLPPETNDFQDRLRNLDNIIINTLTNPFLQKNIDENHNDTFSVKAYFPASNGQLDNIEDFERLGYVRPKPSRLDVCLGRHSFANKSNSSLKSSASVSNLSRGSRIYQEETPTIYKVKSLVDLDSESPSHHHSKKLTHSRPQRSKTATPHSKSNSSSRTTLAPPRNKSSRKNKSKGQHASHPSSSHSHTTSHSTIEHKKKKGSIASFFKKMFA